MATNASHTCPLGFAAEGVPLILAKDGLKRRSINTRPYKRDRADWRPCIPSMPAILPTAQEKRKNLSAIFHALKRRIARRDKDQCNAHDGGQHV